MPVANCTTEDLQNPKPRKHLGGCKDSPLLEAFDFALFTRFTPAPLFTLCLLRVKKYPGHWQSPPKIRQLGEKCISDNIYLFSSGRQV